MVLELLKNNYERNDAHYYNEKVENNTSKNKKNKKKKPILVEESEKDYRNLDSENNEEAHNTYERIKTKPNNIYEEKNDFSFQNLDKKGLREKINMRESYRNSKEIIQYGTNENDIFTEDMFENDNFDDDSFVEDDTMDYKTYNSYTKPEFNLFGRYSSEKIKKNIMSNKKHGKIEDFYKKYKNNNEYSKQANEHDTNIIQFLNNNKKSVDYGKMKDINSKKNDSHNYSDSNKYKNEFFKNYNYDNKYTNNYARDNNRDSNSNYYADGNETKDNNEEDDDTDDTYDDNEEDDDSRDDNDDYCQYNRCEVESDTNQIRSNEKRYNESIKHINESNLKLNKEPLLKRETYTKKDNIFYIKKDITPYKKEHSSNTFSLYNNSKNSNEHNNYETKFMNYKQDAEKEDEKCLKNIKKERNDEFLKKYMYENALKKTYSSKDLQFNRLDDEKNILHHDINVDNKLFRLDKYERSNTQDISNKPNKYNMIGNDTTECNKIRSKDEIKNYSEYTNKYLAGNIYEKDDSYILKRKELGRNELKVADNAILNINPDDKKKKHIKTFLDKIKYRKNSEAFLKNERDKYAEIQETNKKDKVKMKFADILHTKNLSNFFHRGKNSIAKSLSPNNTNKRNISFNNEAFNLNILEKKDKNLGYKQYDIKCCPYDHENTSFHPSVREETKYYENKESRKRLDYNCDEDNYIENNIRRYPENNIDYNSINIERTINLREDIKYNELLNKPDKIDSEQFSNNFNDNKQKGIKNGDSNTIRDTNKLYCQANSSNALRNSYIKKESTGKIFDILESNSNNMRKFIDKMDYYTKKYEHNLYKNDKGIYIKENKLPDTRQALYSKKDSPMKVTDEIKDSQYENYNRIKYKLKMKQERRDEEDETDTNIDKRLIRKMIENNKLKEQNESNDELIVTPFYIKSKIDKVLKNSEIFERSARATFKQFDVKNKNFLHFSEIESLIQKLCYNLELPPVDKKILSIVYKDYDSSKNNCMNYMDFRQMYWDLLKQIKKKYYPTKNFKIKRNCIISRKKLQGYDYSSIYNYLSFKKILGCGAFGEVHLVEDNICKLYKVVKILKKKKMKNIKVNEEINVLIYLDHPNIIKIFDVYESVNCTYIVMELCEGGELMNKIKKPENFSENYIKNIMFQILCAIAYMHSNNIAHKDLKPENILFKTDGYDSLKIIDFGLAELINKSEGISKTAAGTVLYMAPEVFKKKFTIKCDIWSAGVIMYFLFTKNLPFTGSTYEEVKQNIFNNEPDYQSLKLKMSKPALHLLKLMLEKDYNKRPMAAVLLHHPWFQGYFDPIDILPSTLNNIKSYMKHSNIRNVIVNIMAHELCVINNHIKYINDIFLKIDANHNGSLSHREIYNVLSNAGVKKWDINRIIQALDVNDKGCITYTEFIAGCYRWKNIESTFLKAAFNKIDKDEDGYISKSDLVTLVHDNDVNNNDIDNFFISVCSIKKSITKDKKINKISFEDFKDYMLSTF
ncbi:calcium-dependent protein kinase 6, putative [Plasmodium chabaudi chabaudi]|uniref:non-specific serine/threonine protein kinase n=1 Tax=Plasmodium chabaudi chabaudi TaxID=31271 RepID=A0A1C6YFF0_PLACU|nr:calcium-dependent protein kinase 6, putative [Plasmodium chabaudi chabaudi]SCN60388.1 calcium-dependent protein kinase 6, putative [Plasmodium chabaudi chabaudi]